MYLHVHTIKKTLSVSVKQREDYVYQNQTIVLLVVINK